jgi:hypothetical protein
MDFGENVLRRIFETNGREVRRMKLHNTELVLPNFHHLLLG